MIEKNGEKPLIIFEINDLRHSNSWGKRSNYSDDVFKSSVKTIVYSDKSIVHDYTITDKFNNILNKGQLNFDKGFNNSGYLNTNNFIEYYNSFTKYPKHFNSFFIFQVLIMEIWKKEILA